MPKCAKLGWSDPKRESVLIPFKMAEGEGFEPPEPLLVQRFSRPPHSTTLPPFRMMGRKTGSGPKGKTQSHRGEVDECVLLCIRDGDDGQEGRGGRQGAKLAHWELE